MRGLFQLLQLRCDVALHIGKGLLANEIIGHLAGLRAAQLEIIAKDSVVADFELAQLGLFPFLALQLQNDLFTVPQEAHQPVEFGIKFCI